MGDDYFKNYWICKHVILKALGSNWLNNTLHLQTGQYAILFRTIHTFIYNVSAIPFAIILLLTQKSRLQDYTTIFTLP